MSPKAMERTLAGAAGLYAGAVLASAVACALFLSGDGWMYEAQFVRSPIALMALSSALMGVAGLARTAGGRPPFVSATAGALGTVVWGAILFATY